MGSCTRVPQGESKKVGTSKKGLSEGLDRGEGHDNLVGTGDRPRPHVIVLGVCPDEACEGEGCPADVIK